MSAAITQAMVLAAGLGTRMGALTRHRPKPLVEVAGRPLIDRVIDRLHAAGITSIVVNLHYQADQLEAHLRRRQDVTLHFSDERAALLDTGGGLAKALPLFGNRPFIAHNSDSIWIEQETQNLRALMTAWEDARMDALLLVAERSAAVGYSGAGDFNLAPDGGLTRRGAAETAPYVWTGVQILHPRLFTGCPDGAFSANVLLDRALAAGRLFGQELRGTWMHVGSPEGVDEASRLIHRSETG